MHVENCMKRLGTTTYLSSINGSGGIDGSGIERGGTGGIDGSCINGDFIDGSSINGISGGGIDGDGCHYVWRGDG